MLRLRGEPIRRGLVRRCFLFANHPNPNPPSSFISIPLPLSPSLPLPHTTFSSFSSIQSLASKCYTSFLLLLRFHGSGLPWVEVYSSENALGIVFERPGMGPLSSNLEHNTWPRVEARFGPWLFLFLGDGSGLPKVEEADILTKLEKGRPPLVWVQDSGFGLWVQFEG